MVLPAALAAAKEAGDHVWAERPDMTDVVADDLVMAPLLDRFFHAERKSEVHRSREELLRPVEAMDSQELLRPQDAERLKELRANLVLAAVAAGRRDEHRPHPLAVPQHRKKPVVLVVRVRIGLHERPDRGELPEHQLQRNLARQLSNGLRAELSRNRDGEERDKDETKEGDSQASGVRVNGSGVLRFYRFKVTGSRFKVQARPQGPQL